MSTAFALAPPANKGLATLNRALFKKAINLVAIRVPAAACSRAMKELPEGSVLDYPRLRGIVEDPAEKQNGGKKKSTSRLVLLHPAIAGAPDRLAPIIYKFVQKEGGEITNYELNLDYDYWTADQVLRSILPDEIDIPGSFETVGHIAHLNLRDQYLPYKHIIGQVLLDKNSNLRTIVNKTGNIDHTFRFFQMELLGGEDNMMAEVNESNCKFRFDFSRVYWNSRLQREHERIVSSFKREQLVCDVFGGVGPYAVPAAKNKNCLVFANDLNPASYEFLRENIRLNKVEHLVKPFNMDGREFIRNSIKELNAPNALDELRSKVPAPKKPRTPKSSKTQSTTDTEPPSTPTPTITPVAHNLGPLESTTGFRWFDHYVMNLPGTAIEFLDAFWCLFKGQEEHVPADKLPLIHCHCFSREEDATKDVVERVEAVMGARIGDNLIKVHNVRNVAPNKDMLCISFRLPAEVAFASQPPVR
ncbi:guanine(37)-N1-methyltransferase [Powellomyces hirtus]|nr:guanine(37)-N1-methyltransferase [Powellomyces hirtus]